MYLDYDVPDQPKLMIYYRNNVDIKQYWWQDATLSNTTFQETREE